MAGYGDDTGLEAWLDANGHTLPAGAPSLDILRERGSAYIDGQYGSRFSGIPVDVLAQERAWPRTGAYAYGQAIGDTVIPTAVINASYAAAWAEATAPGSLSVVVNPSRLVKRQKVDGAVEREFFGPGEGQSAIEAATPVLTLVEGLLAPFLKPVDTGIGIMVV